MSHLMMESLICPSPLCEKLNYSYSLTFKCLPLSSLVCHVCPIELVFLSHSTSDIQMPTQTQKPHTHTHIHAQAICSLREKWKVLFCEVKIVWSCLPHTSLFQNKHDQAVFQGSARSFITSMSNTGLFNIYERE